MAPLGYVLSPHLLELVHATPAVQRRGAAVPAHDVRVQHRHADVLHARRRAARGGRRADAAAARRRDDRAEHRAQRRADPRLRAGPGVRHARRGDRHVHRPARSSRRRRLAAPAAARWSSRFPRSDVVAPDWSDRPVAVPVRPAGRRPGRGDEPRRRDAAAVHRLARAQRRSAGGLCGRLRGAVLADHVDVGRA